MPTWSVIARCIFCSNELVTKIEVPKGWTNGIYNTNPCIEYEKNIICPNHENILPFLQKACSGCSYNFLDSGNPCPLWKKFGYEDLMTPGDYMALETGVCPVRHNGTFSVEKGKVKEVNLSHPAARAGKNLAKEIRAFINIWIKEENDTSEANDI
jgi:hypothetical protein